MPGSASASRSSSASSASSVVTAAAVAVERHDCMPQLASHVAKLTQFGCLRQHRRAYRCCPRTTME
jgi:hypothetical protein